MEVLFDAVFQNIGQGFSSDWPEWWFLLAHLMIVLNATPGLICIMFWEYFGTGHPPPPSWHPRMTRGKTTQKRHIWGQFWPRVIYIHPILYKALFRKVFWASFGHIWFFFFKPILLLIYKYMIGWIGGALCIDEDMIGRLRLLWRLHRQLLKNYWDADDLDQFLTWKNK